MRSLVVLLSAMAVACAAPQHFVQPPNTPAVFLDASGRPLDTAEVASARALHYQAKLLEGHVLRKRSIGHVSTADSAWPAQTLYAAPAASAVSHQSRVDVRSSPAVYAAAPTVVETQAVVAEPLYATRALVSGPTKYIGGSAVSHQSRVDVHSSPAVIETFEAPAVVAEPVYAARAVVAGPTTYIGGSAVSHQSRVDVRSSPAIIETVEAPAVVSEPVYAARAVVAGPTTYVGGSAVSHQSRVDVRSSPAVIETVEAPAVVAEPVYATRAVVAGPTTYVGGSAVSHQSRVDVQSSPAIVAQQVVSPVARAIYPSVVSEPVVAHAVVGGPSVYSGGSAVSHQSRVDVESSPAVVSQHVVTPAVVEARSGWSPASYW